MNLYSKFISCIILAMCAAKATASDVAATSSQNPEDNIPKVNNPHLEIITYDDAKKTSMSRLPLDMIDYINLFLAPSLMQRMNLDRILLSYLMMSY